MPEPVLSPLSFVADLTIEVGDDRGSTTAQLSNDRDGAGDGVGGLVLDVPDPATLLRCVPGRGLSRDLPVSLPLARLADVPVRLTSQGRDLGLVHVTSAGQVRLRPSMSGVPTLVHTALSQRTGRLAAAVVGAAAVVTLAYLVRRRT